MVFRKPVSHMVRFYWIVGLLILYNTLESRAATITWTNTNGGVWSGFTNWNPHFVPGAADTALITVPGTYTVTSDVAVAVFKLTLGGASGQQTLTNNNQDIGVTNILVAANGIFSFGGGTLSGGPMTNQGTVNLGGGTVVVPLDVNATGILNFSGGGVGLENGLTNRGTIQWSGGSSTITIYNNHGVFNGAIYNQPGALFNIQNDQTLYSAGYGLEFFSNAGTVLKSGGPGATTINVLFTNTGVLNAQSGTITFQGGGNIGGTYNTASGATIQFNAGTYAETGAATNTGSGLFRLNGGTAILNDRITKFVLASGNVVLSPTFQGSGAIQNLQLDGAYLIGTNRVSGTLGINGGGLASASPLTVTATGVLNFNGASVNLYAPLTNLGTINWSGGALSLANNAGIYTCVIYNQPGALFNIQNDQTMASAGYGLESFINSGTVRKSAGLGISTFNVAFTNSGTVDAQTGTIQFGSGGNLGGTYNTAYGATIQFSTGSYSQSGPVTVSGSGVCQQNGATVTLLDQIANLVLASGNVVLSPIFQTNGAIHNLQLHGAYLMGTNRVTGALGFDGGGVGSASPLTIATNGVLNFNGAGVNINAPLTNFGTINWSGGAISVANNAAVYTGVIYNQTGGLLYLLSDQSLTAAGYGLELFRNAGTVRKAVGLGVSTINVTTTNTGLVDAQSGTIQFGGSGNISGAYNTASGATIQFSAGSYVETGTPTITGSGLCRQYGANVTLKDRIVNFVLTLGNVILTPTFQGSGAIQSLQLDGAYLTGTNTVIGTLGFNGGGLLSGSPLTVTASGVLNFNGAGININAPLTNKGTMNWSSGGLAVNNNAGLYTGLLINQGLFNLQCDQGIATGGYGLENFSNSGTVRKTAGLGSSTINVAFTNTGTLDAQSGTIAISGAYTQTGGTMNFGITSLAYFGKIGFSTVAPLTGTLSVNFNGSYVPSAGDSFTLMSYGSLSGIFTGLALPPQASWQTNYGATTFTLSVLTSSGIAPVTLTPVSLAGGTYTLKLNGSVGPTYVLLASSNLAAWTALSTSTPSVMPLTVTDTNAGKFKSRFYRALITQ
jgi:hypothetical protein